MMTVARWVRCYAHAQHWLALLQTNHETKAIRASSDLSRSIGSGQIIGRCGERSDQLRAVGRLERGLVLPVVITCVVLLPIAGLAFYAMHRSKPSRLKLSASLLRLFSFSIEVESQDDPPGR
jgi:hypothetical protein